MTAEPLDRRTAPGAGARDKPFQVPAFDRSRLASGLELILAPRHDLPTAEALLLFPFAGGDRSPHGRPGLAALSAALLDEGTRQRSGLELALELEGLGASLNTGADWDAAHLELSLLATDLETGLERLAEVAREPSFPPDEVERVRAQWLTELLRRSDQPGLLAEDLFAATVYAGTPYQHRLHGTTSALRAIEAVEFEQFHAAGYGAERAILLIGGDFDPDRIVPRIERLFDSWPASSPALWPEIKPVAQEGIRILVLDRPQAAQTEIRIGHASVPRTHPDRTLLGVLNAILGGKFTSRLNLNLRERHGFTYGVSSRFVGRRGPGPFAISMAVANESAGAAVRETLFELERICREPASPTELEETQSYLAGVFPYPYQTVGGWVAKLADLAVYGFPDDHYQRTQNEIQSADLETLHRLAAAHLQPTRCVIVAAGPAATLASQFAEFGDVEVVEIDRG